MQNMGAWMVGLDQHSVALKYNGVCCSVFLVKTFCFRPSFPIAKISMSMDFAHQVS